MEQEFTRVMDLLYLAKQNGVEVILNDDRLQLKIPENKQIDPSLLNEIKDNKALIIAFLKNEDWKSKKVNKNYNKINKADLSAYERIPLSFSQERLWFIDRLEGSVQYHTPIILRLRGALNIEALSFSLSAIVDRHEVLRTVFHEQDGTPFQVIKDTHGWSLNIINEAGRNEETGLKQFVTNLINQPFDLANDYMLRAALVVLGHEEHILVVTIHHIASDGWSIPVIVREVGELYKSFEENRQADLPPLTLQYADYAIWQRNFLQGKALDEKVKYWKEKLNQVSPLQLSTDYARPAVQSAKGATTSVFLKNELSAQLHELSLKEGATLFMTLLAAMKVLLYRYSGQGDICVGTSIANRSQKEIESLVGFFVNTLALRTHVDGKGSFYELLRQVKVTTVGAYEHQDVPFEKVVEAVLKERDTSRTPLFQAMLVLANAPESSKLRLGKMALSREHFELATAKFDITFFVTEAPNGLHISLNYCTDLFSRQTIDRMLAHYTELLHSIVKAPHQKIGLLPMLSGEEEITLLNLFSTSSVDYPQDKNVIDLFEEQVSKTPRNKAVVFDGESLTYQQLNNRANQLARLLHDKGVEKGSLIPLFIERGIDMLVGILGILKAGCAYVPIDTDFPAQRVSYILDDVGCSVIVSSRLSRSKMDASNNLQIIDADADFFITTSIATSNIYEVSGSGHLAYVIYTSGSTGTPKGVMIEHRSLVDYVFGLNKNLQVDQCSSFALVSTIATDLGNTVIYSSLLTGGALHLFSKETSSDAEALGQYFEEQSIDCLKIVPSHWLALSPDESLLLPRKLLIFGGEALQTSVVRRIQNSDSSCRVANHYGPTETSIGKLFHEVKLDIEYGSTIPIGKPFSNTRIYVLNPELSLCPMGVPGQLYISGAGLARGYVNNSVLTEEKFIENPFTQSVSKMYMTGDVVKYLPDGNISFIGRFDNQVKIRGYRVELGDIESAILQTGLVKEAAVLALDDKQENKRLVGYVVGPEEFAREELAALLQDKLPEYMIPAVWIKLERMPLTANGKVDRHALPNPEIDELLKGTYAAPRDAKELGMARIWQDILEVDQVGIHDDFFELGGHSLLAVRLISAIRKQLGIEISINDIFDYPTIAQLCEQLQSQTNENTVVIPSITAGVRPDKIPLSFSQERLWFIDRLEGSIQYHVPAVLRLNGKLNVEALSFALKTVVQRHEALRTIFLDDNGQAYQSIKDFKNWKLTEVDGRIFDKEKDRLREYIERLIRKPFDLSNDYMIRAHLIELNKNAYVLVVTLHHITSDRWSRFILVKEVVELYNSYEANGQAQLPEIKVQYADFSIWQRQHLEGEQLAKKLGYWKQKLRGSKVLHLPADYTRPLVQSTKGSWVGFQIDSALTEQLMSFSQKQGATIFMTLLAAFKVLLYRYSGQEDIVVGTAVAGRQQQELEGLIGFFVNTLALRSNANGEDTFLQFLSQVRTTTLDAFANQEIPFEKIVDETMGERGLSTDPLVQIMFGLQNTPEIPSLYLGEAKLSQDNHANNTTLFELFMNMVETKNGLQGFVQYSTEIYRHESIVRLVSHYKQILNAIVQNAAMQIARLAMLSTEEEFQIISVFNNNKFLYPKNKSIIDFFEEQVVKTPWKKAVIFGSQQISYSELNDKSSQLANYLVASGVKPGQNIGLLSLRRIEMVIAMFGILKAGAAYVPLNTAYPQDRLVYMLEDAEISIIVCTDETLSQTFDLHNYELVTIEDAVNAESSSPGVQTVADSPVYVMYTSGTTGHPKGIVVCNRNVTKLVREPNDIEVKPDDVMLQWSNYAFDGSIYEIYSSLLNGAQLVLIDDDSASDINELSKVIRQNKVSVCFVTTALFNAFVDVDLSSLTGLRKILFGGEMVSFLHVQRALQVLGEDKIVHVYGPTETTVYATYFPIAHISERNAIPIGKPLANTNLLVLDKNQQVVPVGVPGELYIGGDGVSLGYLNKPALTSAKFIACKILENTIENLYRTGDLVKWLPDGNIDFLGRLDEQVKVRGYRIELGEIESVLTQSGLVSQAVVLTKDDKDGNKRLIGYFVPHRSVLKKQESELYTRLVASWKDLYETEYAKTEQNEKINHEFNIIGWNDSFTGEAIPETHMREWLNDITNVIFAEKMTNVLEIGSGTGLIFYQLAGKVEKYFGTDFSKSSTAQINQRIDVGSRDYGFVQMQTVAAHEFVLEADQSVDTILLNSIIQYFPGEDYLDDVVDKSITALKGNGRIIIGDVRDNRLLELFKARLQLRKLQNTLDLNEFKWIVQQDVLKEEELCLSPEYFYALQEKYPEITNVEIVWKNSSYVNELTLYRYTVIIHVGITKTVVKPGWIAWKDVDQETVLHQFANAEPIISIEGFPNPRLWQERVIANVLQDKTLYNVGEILSALESENEENLHAKKLFQTAEANHYSYKLLLNEDPLKVNVFFELRPSNAFIEQPYKKDLINIWGYNSNIPLFIDISSLLQKDIRLKLQERLPEYMIPSELITVGKLPLTSNGKVDRRFLSERESGISLNKVNYEAPGTKTETMLTGVWQDLLAVERIGIHDNFFELGGHSLLATRVISAIHKRLPIQVTIKDLFLYPTVADLASLIDTQVHADHSSPVRVAQRPKNIPLSFSQERLLFIHQLEGSTHYHIPAVLTLKGDLNVMALQDALKAIIVRHEALRTIFYQEDFQSYQQVISAENWRLQIITGNESRRDLGDLIERLVKIPFDLSNDYMLRAALINVDTNEHILVVTMHHIASDGWSFSILVKEFAELYSAFKDGNTIELPPLELQFADFAIWQRSSGEEERIKNKITYWKEKLTNAAQLTLPTDFTRPLVLGTGGGVVDFTIDKDLLSLLQNFSRERQVTLFMTTLSVFKILLHRYSGQNDISVGTSIAGRQNKEIEELIGFFVNMLALRTSIDGDLSFIDIVQKVSVTMLEAYDHQEVPFEKVVDAIVTERDMSRNPLVQVMFILLNTPEVPDLQMGNLSLRREGVKNTTSKFDITFLLTETPFGLRGSVQYSTALFKKDTILRMITHFKQLLSAAIQHPTGKIELFNLLAPAEEQFLLTNFITSKYPHQASIVDVFEKQVSSTPDNVALVFENQKLTYAELNIRANQLAHYLEKRKVVEGVLVPICLERSLDLIVAILGVLKAGGGYVTIDPQYPAERIEFMLSDTKASLVITSSELRADLNAAVAVDQVLIDKEWPAIANGSIHNPSHSLDHSSLAYVTYTSGSTGFPKGVLVGHGNVVSLVKGVDYITLSKNDVLLSTGSPSFDATTFEYWSMLLNGGKLILCSDTHLLDTALLKQEIVNHEVTKMWFTAGWFNQLIENDPHIFETLETILVGGERLSEWHIEKALQAYPYLEIINGYGPTENTTFSLSHHIVEVEKGRSIPVGKPLSNRNAIILDSANQLVPVGVLGEICLGGAGLAKGYLNQPELTDEKFIANPFSAEPGQGLRLYRSGDIGRWLPDGNIEYVGRMDDQVKIRGYRIEPGEIESVLMQSGLVKQTIVLARDDKQNGKKLVAYIVPETLFDKEELIEYLQDKLPDYMVPAAWVAIDRLPLTPNGKVDRRALPDPEADAVVTKGYVSPRNETEEKIAAIWQNIIEVDQVGVHDDFFELGGHSLMAIRVVAAIRKKLDAELSMESLFVNPTVAQLAELIQTSKTSVLNNSVKFKSLVPIKSGGSKIPLYIVSGGGGTVFAFKNFAEKLDADQPVYGFQQPTEEKYLTEFPETVQGIAAQFVEDILIQNPGGPYALSGHCLGGVIAYEMSKQLKAMGKKVALLAMFDTVVRTRIKLEPPNLKNWFGAPRRLKKSFNYIYSKIDFETFLLRKHTKHAIRYKVNSFKALANKMNPYQVRNGAMDVFKKLEKNFITASLNYHLTPYDGDVLVFYAKDHYYFLDKDNNVGYKKYFLNDTTKNIWKKYVKSITMYEIEGEHSTIFYPQHVKPFAELLQKHLDECNVHKDKS